MPVNNLIQLRKGSSSTWSSQNPVLSSGEPGYDLTNNILKVGDGVTPWNNLSGISTNLDTSLAAGSGIIFSYADSTLTISTSGGGGGLNNVVEDITPQLGGNLDLNSYYINGTGNINISGNLIANTGTLDKLQFNINNGSVNSQGQIGWNSTEGTVDIALTDSTVMEIGQHRFFRVRNVTGSPLYKGQVVYASGVHANGIITPNLYIANGTINEIRLIGLVFDTINNNNNGYVIDFGHLRNLDLDGTATNYAVGDETWSNGDILYAHPTVAGKLTKVAPKHAISLAIILDDASANGQLFVRPTNFGDLSDNHDVDVSGVTNGQFLQYNSVTDYWVPSSSGNFTTLQLNGTTVSVSGHSHTSSDITNFNSSVSGLLPVKNIIAGTGIAVSSSEGSFTINASGGGGGTTIINPADNRILTSDGTSTGINAESNLIFDGTNLGIGTSDPLRKLTITGGGFAFVDSGGANRSIHWGNTDNTFPVTIGGVATSGNCYLIFSTNTFGNAATERMRIDGSGNSTFKGRVDITSGTTAGAQTHFYVRPENGALGRDSQITLGCTFSNGWGGGDTIARDAGAIRFGANGGSADPRDWSMRFLVANGPAGSDTPRECMRITAAGSVGIGSTSPQTALQISKNADGALLILSGAQSANTQSILFRNPYHTNNSTAGTAFIGAQDTGSQGGNLIFATTSNSSGTSGTPTERMRVDASGNVGIGTTSPTARLHVAGTSSTFNGLLLTTTAAGGGSYASIEIGTYYPTWTVASPASLRFIDDNNFSTHITFRTKTSGSASNSDVERFRITSAGNTEIRANAGNVSSAFVYNENGGELVHYDETQTAATLLDQSSNQTRLLELINGSNLVLGLGGSNTTGSIVFVRAGYNEAMRIDSTGAAWMKTTRAWNDTVPTLNIGNDGDGRLQTRHIWGKLSSSTAAEHLWLQHGNTNHHVQIGATGGGNNLYVAGDIYANGYFGGALLLYGASGMRRGVHQITNWNQTTLPDVAFLSSENSVTNAPTTDFSYGIQYAFHRSGAAFRTQLVTSLYSDLDIWVRNSRDSDVWTAWKKLLHSSNYNSYSPTLTGGGASGTWGINITGTATSLTSGDKTIAGVLGATRFYNTNAVSTDSGFGLYFNGSSDTAYAIYREGGAFSSPFPDLRIGFHTGIKIGANATYNGVRFYTDYDMSSQVMSVNNASDGLGAANVYVNNSLQAGSSLRAPIFYDSNDTNFYCDPNGTSRFASLVITSENLYVGDGASYTFIRMRDGDEGERLIHCNSNRIGFLNQSGGWGSWCEDDGSWATDFAVYAPIFYDRNNTAYYLDPASTSVLNRVNPVGWDTSGRNYSREWIEFPNHSALYSPLNSAYFYPNNASYGAWRIAGTRNGWGGLEFDSTGAGQISLMMNSGHTGVHNNTYGWQWYWTNGAFYVSKATYGGGTIATVLDTSNYTSNAPVSVRTFRAWGVYDGSASSANPGDGVNMGTMTRSGTATYTCNFAITLPNTNYGVLVSGQVGSMVTQTRNTGSVVIVAQNLNGVQTQATYFTVGIVDTI